ncbi:MAG: hypothetical protein ABR961_09695 [Thermoanaerobaculaceae bacterium]
MSPNPRSFIQHLQAEGYHPRSNRHSNALAVAIAGDLVEHCPLIRDRAASGELVYCINFTLRAGTADWNVDLVLGRPSLGDIAPQPAGTIRELQPSSVDIAIEIKAVMTEHHKAAKNRKRDLEAHHEHVHHYNNAAVAGGVLIINGSDRFQSPLRSEVTVHKNPSKLVQHCVNQLRAVAERGGLVGTGLEARCAIVVKCENIGNSHVTYLTAAPAPQVGDPLHYDAFIQAICQHYTLRARP